MFQSCFLHPSLDHCLCLKFKFQQPLKMICRGNTVSLNEVPYFDIFSLKKSFVQIWVTMQHSLFPYNLYSLAHNIVILLESIQPWQLLVLWEILNFYIFFPDWCLTLLCKSPYVTKSKRKIFSICHPLILKQEF